MKTSIAHRTAGRTDCSPCFRRQPGCCRSGLDQRHVGANGPVISALIGDDSLFATANLTVLLSSGGLNRTQHYGPYASGSPDSGTCGNDWAEDTFDRHFTVRSNHDGTYTVVQQFKNGSFVTNPPDPGQPRIVRPRRTAACRARLTLALTGSMHGYFIISTVVNADLDRPALRRATMERTILATQPIFINSHFMDCYPATCTVTTFFNHYAAGDQGLVEHEWKNASDDRGGNHGDIRSTNVP